MISREDFYLWKSSAAHQEFMQAIQENVDMAAREILNRQESKPERDMYLRGFMQGLTAIFNWEPEFQDNQKEYVDE